MRRLTLIVCALVLAAPLAGCGNKEDEIKSAETEGAYLDLGDLRYQVQISRQLNPTDVEDRAYLEGLPRSERRLARGQSWFGVFMRVENTTDVPHPTASQFELEDTDGTKYRPTPLPPSNPFAYVARPLAAKETVPLNSSVAQANESINGSLVLFKVRTASFANRPLELKILGPTVPQDEASVDLDV